MVFSFSPSEVARSWDFLLDGCTVPGGGGQTLVSESHGISHSFHVIYFSFSRWGGQKLLNWFLDSSPRELTHVPFLSRCLHEGKEGLGLPVPPPC